MDADTALLNGTLDETIYMKFPPDYKPEPTTVTRLRLVKSLYGLKQSPLVWWMLLSSYLQSIGFKRLDANSGRYF
ncbi:hypothetical protein NCC49_004659 [Naganishia albida]|nr:hypothetical protein NCC49_004659 [Naganishia albida]